MSDTRKGWVLSEYTINGETTVIRPRDDAARRMDKGMTNEFVFDGSTIVGGSITVTGVNGTSSTLFTSVTPETDENTIRKITKIVDFARQLESDIRSVVPQIEPIVKATGALREAAEKNGLNKRQRLALGDAVSKSIREGLE